MESNIPPKEHKMRKQTFVLAAVLFAAVSVSWAQKDSQKPKDDAMKDCPLHEQHMEAKKGGSDHSHASGSGTTLESRGNVAIGL